MAYLDRFCYCRLLFVYSYKPADKRKAKLRQYNIMRSSRIYSIVSINDRSANASFGTSEGFRQDIRVGTSASNSETIAEISTDHYINEDGNYVYNFFVDGTNVKQKVYNPKSKTWIK